MKISKDNLFIETGGDVMNYKTALTNLDLVYPDGVAKVFALWTEKGIEIQNKTTNIFLDVFSVVKK